jgi:hypothetical protein
MLGVDEYIVNLLAALVHLRIFAFEFTIHSPIEDVDQFTMEVSDRAPHLEYFSIPALDHYYKRVGGELVVCDQTECPEFTFADN